MSAPPERGGVISADAHCAAFAVASVPEQLKNATADLHRRIESVVPLSNPGLLLEEYTGYLERILPFYEAVEESLRRISSLRAAVSDLEERWKTRLIRQDLRSFGLSRHERSETPVIPVLRTVPQGVGCLYLLGESSLES